MKVTVILFVTSICFLSERMDAQVTLTLGKADLHKGKIGIGVDGFSGSPNLLVKYFFNNQLAAQLIAGMEIDISGGTALPGYTKVTGIATRAGVSLLFHLTQDQVSPYIGVEGIFESSREGGFFQMDRDRKNSIRGILLFGAEYFVVERFSIGIKQGIGAHVHFKRTTPNEAEETRLATSTQMTGRVYFN